MKPMLARTYGPKYTRFPCYVQPKLNGVRALTQVIKSAGVLQSRDEKLWRYPVMHHIIDELVSLSSIIGGRILDGELYRHGWKLQRINGAVAVNRNEAIADTSEVEYHVFDTVAIDRPFSERWIDLQNDLKAADLPHIKVVDTAMAHDRGQLERYFHAATAQGYEGVMLRPDGPYEFGETSHGTQKRSEFLWKYKQWQDDEFWCVGITPGEGKADIGVGALILAKERRVPWLLIEAQSYHSTFKVGTGFDDAERILYMQNPPIGKLIRVRYLELTQDGIPFNPSFICVMP